MLLILNPFCLLICNEFYHYYATEASASSWLTVLLVEEHGLALHKGVLFAYIKGGILPFVCAHSKNFTVEHAMNCPTSGFPTIRHNEKCAFTASLVRVML